MEESLKQTKTKEIEILKNLFDEITSSAKNKYNLDVDFLFKDRLIEFENYFEKELRQEELEILKNKLNNDLTNVNIEKDKTKI